MNSMMRLLVTALLVFSGCQSVDLFSAFKSEQPSKQVADQNASSQQSRSSNTRVAEVSQAAASIPAASSEQVRQGQLLVATWYRDAKPETLAKARQHFETALRQQPHNVDALHGMGIVADLQKQYTEAEKNYLLALAEQPSNSKVLGDLGYSYLLQKRLQESEQYLNRALVHDPNNQNAIKHLGDVYAQKGQADLARETYRRVLNETEVEQAIAANAATAPAESRSLFDRMRSKPSAQEALASDLQLRMDANREREQNKQRQQQLAGGATPPHPGSRQLHGDALRDELNNIDRERYANISRGPIVLGNSGEPQQQLPGADYQNNWANQGQPPSMNGISVNMSQNPANMAANGPGGWAEQGSPQPNNTENWSHPGAVSTAPHQPNMPAPQGYPGYGSGASMPPANSQGGDLARLTQPWGQPVAQAQGFNSGPPANVDPAYYQQQQQQQQQQQGYNSASPYMQPQMNAQPGAMTAAAPGQENRAPAQSASDPLQEASKAAARVGMGFGPGAMFPVFSQSATQSMPGSSSMLNGAANAPPQRYLPTDAPPVDLRQQMSVQMPESQIMTNQYGQQVPMGGAHMTSPHQLGTTSRYTPNNVPSQYNDSRQNLQMYDDQRNRAANDLNSAIQQTGGRQMQSAPQGGQGTNYPGGSVMYSPQGGSQYTYPNQQPTPPPRYPANSRPAMNDSAPSSNAMPRNEVAPPQSSRDIVIPETYPARNSGYSTRAASGTQPEVGPSQRISNWEDSLPQIVPGR